VRLERDAGLEIGEAISVAVERAVENAADLRLAPGRKHALHPVIAVRGSHLATRQRGDAQPDEKDHAAMIRFSRRIALDR